MSSNDKYSIVVVPKEQPCLSFLTRSTQLTVGGDLATALISHDSSLFVILRKAAPVKMPNGKSDEFMD